MAIALVVANWVLKPTGGWGVLWFFSLLLVGIPGVMLSLHLHPPRFFKHLERTKK